MPIGVERDDTVGVGPLSERTDRLGRARVRQVRFVDRVEPAGEPKGTTAAVTRSDARSEAGDALVALGYRPAEVTKLLANLDIENMSAEDIIRQALKQAVK